MLKARVILANCSYCRGRDIDVLQIPVQGMVFKFGSRIWFIILPVRVESILLAVIVRQ